MVKNRIAGGISVNITEFQEKVKEIEEIRGFSEETTEEKIEFLKQEVDELIDAVINKTNIAEEVVDAFSVLMMIVDREKIDFEKAFIEKMNKDKLRIN